MEDIMYLLELVASRACAGEIYAELGRGVGLGQADVNGNTVLHLAAAYMDLPLLKSLVARGGDWRRENVFEESPVVLAMKTGAVECVKYLKELGAEAPECPVERPVECPVERPVECPGEKYYDVEAKCLYVRQFSSWEDIEKWPELYECESFAIGEDNRRPITGFPEYFKKLTNIRKLFCSDQKLTNFVNMPPNASVVELDGNFIRSCKGAPEGIKVLNLDWNWIEDIQDAPDSVEELYINNHNLREITKLPRSIKKFRADLSPEVWRDNPLQRVSCVVKKFSVVASVRLLKAVAEQESLDVIMEAMEDGADVNAKDSGGNMAIHYAARYGNISLLKYFVAQGSKMFQLNARGESPATLAVVHQDRPDLMNYMFHTMLFGESDRHLGPYDVFYFAIHGKWHALEQAIHHDILSDSWELPIRKDDKGNTVPYYLAKHGHTRLLKKFRQQYGHY